MRVAQMHSRCLEDRNLMLRVPFRGYLGILGMYSSLTGRRAKIATGFMIFGEFMMALGYGRLNRVGAINRYNELLIPKFNLS